MKEHQMYPHNPNSAESILTEKLKDVSHGWFDNQRSIVLEAMEDYAKHCLEAEHERMAELLKEERNKVIEDCVVHLGNKFPGYGPKEFSIREIRKELESLKGKSQ